MIRFSKHARQRYSERFPERIMAGDLVRSINEDLKLSSEVKHWKNDVNFMAEMYEKYGYDKTFQFRMLGSMLFVIDDTDKVLVTIIDSKKSKWTFNTHRFRKKASERV